MNNASLADMIRYYGITEAMSRLEVGDRAVAQGIILSALDQPKHSRDAEFGAWMRNEAGPEGRWYWSQFELRSQPQNGT